MAFWSKLGKFALKAAPIAAMFIPGVGPIASAAIGGLSGAASTKLGGGSWKDALISGGIGAGMGYAGGKVKGIGPSGKVAAKAAGATAAKKAGSSVFGNVLKGVDTGSKLLGALGSVRGGGSSGSPYQSPDFNPSVPAGSRNRPAGTPSIGDAQGPVMPRGGYRWNDNPMNQVDQSSPNLSKSIFQGRQEAIRNQPWRGGYDVKTLGDDDETIVTSRMPPIYPNRKRKGQPLFSYTPPPAQ